MGKGKGKEKIEQGPEMNVQQQIRQALEQKKREDPNRDPKKDPNRDPENDPYPAPELNKRYQKAIDAIGEDIIKLQGMDPEQKREYNNKLDAQRKENENKLIEELKAKGHNLEAMRLANKRLDRGMETVENKEDYNKLVEEWKNAAKELRQPSMAAYMEWVSGMMKIATAYMKLHAILVKDRKTLLKSLKIAGGLSAFAKSQLPDLENYADKPQLSIITEDKNGNLHIPPRFSSTQNLNPDNLNHDLGKMFAQWLDMHGYGINDSGDLIFAATGEKLPEAALKEFKKKYYKSSPYIGFVSLVQNTFDSTISISSEPTVVPQPTRPSPRDNTMKY